LLDSTDQNFPVMASFSLKDQKVVEVFTSPLHNHGVRAVQHLNEGGVVFEERPLAFLQTIENRQCNILCGNCNGFLGGLEMQVGLLTRRLSRQDHESIAEGSGNAIKMCGNQCGELYCSEECRMVHWHDRGHCVLCTGAKDSSDPLVQFKIHAVQTNEIFLLVADVYAGIIASIEKKNSCSLEEAVASSLEPFRGYVQQLWWDAAVAPLGSDPVELRKTLQRLVDESWNLLNLAMRIGDRGLSGSLGPEFMSRLIGMFEQNNVGVRMTSPLGSACLQAQPGGTEGTWLADTAEEIIQVMDEGAWEDCGDECGSEGDDEEGEEDVAAAAVEEDEEALMDADNAHQQWNPEAAGGDVNLERLYTALSRVQGGSDSVFPPLDGTAFYSLICKINHSCEPNVLVKYPPGIPGDGVRPLTAQLFALRSISPGEELLQSYIDQRLPWEQRLAALADYGFECFCGKCQRRE